MKESSAKPLKVSQLKAFDDNYIWLIHGQNKSTEKYIIIVDPGDEYPVLESINKNSFIPQAIFITHHHGDHCGGVEALLKHYDIPVYGPANERISTVSHQCKQDQNLIFESMDLSFKVIDVPGHTRGHIAFLGHQSLFIGDTLFAGGCGKLFEGTFEQMHHSLSKILECDEQTLIYCAHEYTQDNLKFAQIAEPDNQEIIKRIEVTNKLRERNQSTVPSFLKLEKQTNPFLRFNQPTLIKSVSQYHQQQDLRQRLDSAADIFKITRLWKDALDN